MKKAIIQSFNQALAHYVNREQREGYQMTVFSRFRHGFKKNSMISKLEQRMHNAATDEALFDVLAVHFTLPRSRFNHHSFNSYLIDELSRCTDLAHIDWGCFTPRAVKRFEGVVYRGMSRPPKTIFIQGLSEKETSAAYEDYLKTATGSVGVSTSKCFKTAMKYTQNHRRTGDERYVYQIHYRGRGGFDVFETIKARGLQVAGLFGYQRRHAQEKAEVNIRGCVPSADIVGAYRVGEQSTLQWLGNPQYQASTP